MSRAPIAVAGISHRTAPLAEREDLALSPEAARDLLDRGTTPSFLLVTCNRTELYGRESPEHLVERLLAGARSEVDRGRLYALEGADAVRHLFTVAAGLDSMIVGEPQILGQVKRAMELARETGSLGAELDELLRRALSVGRRVRGETAVGDGLPTIPKVATGMARLVLGELGGRRLLVVGAGELGSLTARTLARAGATDVVVTNRSGAAARALAEEVGGRAAPFGDLDRLVLEADVVVTCTGASRPVLSRRRVERIVGRRNGGRPVVVLDIAVPRDVDPEVRGIEGVRLYDLDDLRGWGSDVVAPESLAAAESIVESETAEYLDWLAARAAVPTIRALVERAERILDAELEHARRVDDEAVRQFGHRLVAKLLHVPLTRLREGTVEGGEGFLEVARSLFSIEEDAESSPNGPPGSSG